MKPEDLSIEELQKLLAEKILAEPLASEVDKDVVEEAEDGIVIGEDFKIVRKVLKGPRKEPVKAGKNQWKDTGEMSEVETPEVEPTPRTRQAPSKVEKVCHVCGKSFSIHPSLVSGEYIRCNNCTGR
jgi:DNA-directed RNA polymerase subunit RPC12/RpoP